MSIKGGDNRFYNNIFIGAGNYLTIPANTAKPAANKPRADVGYGLGMYDNRELPLQCGGNVYFNRAKPYANDFNSLALSDVDPKVKITEESGQTFIQFNLGPELKQVSTQPVTTTLLGMAKIAGLPYENVDGSPLKIDTDYFGKARNKTKPTPGPFEKLGQGDFKLKVW